jgi:hypothetical protein
MLGDIIGGLFGASSQRKALKAERHNLQNAVRWRVADAKAAGIHPLAALGMPSYGSNVQPNNALGEGIASAFNKYSQRKANALAEERAALENQLLRSQIKSTDAETMLIGARSRTQLQGARAVTIGGATPTPSIPGVVPVGPPADLTVVPWSNDQVTSQSVADNFGEIQGEVHGLKNAAIDAWRNIFDPMREEWYGPRPKANPRYKKPSVGGYRYWPNP